MSTSRTTTNHGRKIEHIDRIHTTCFREIEELGRNVLIADMAVFVADVEGARVLPSYPRALDLHVERDGDS